MLNYDDMFKYVKDVLEKNDGIRSVKAHLRFRNRYEHIKRVFNWAKRILPGVENCNEEIVLTASIFHDAGYKANRKESHAVLGKRIFLEYAIKNNFPTDFTNIVADLIERHSEKDLIKNPDIPIELVVLMEADLLDEEGALGIVFDLLAEGSKLPDSYESVFGEIMSHSAHILNQDYMITPIARKMWTAKKNLIARFINDLKYDLFIEG